MEITEAEQLIRKYKNLEELETETNIAKLESIVLKTSEGNVELDDSVLWEGSMNDLKTQVMGRISYAKKIIERKIGLWT